MMLVAVGACASPHKPGTGTADPPPPTAIAAEGETTMPDAAATLAPLDDPNGALVTIPLEGGGEAHVALPLGAQSRRPVVVGVHGAGDRADWSCSEWHAIVGASAFVVCPHGADDPRWRGTLVWGSGAAIAHESARAVAALRTRYGAYVADGPMLYGAWSQGATLAGSAVPAAGAGTFSQVVLVEIGHTPVDATATARAFARAGVRKLVVSCSSSPCREFAGRMRAACTAVGLPLHVVDVGLRGHWFDQPVFDALQRELPWMVGDDPRWARDARD
jgi:hypothetical protein